MTTQQKKPLQLRIIFILNAIMMFLPFVFYFVITRNNITIDGLNPVWMLYTAAGYILSFIALVFFILKKHLIGVRAIILLNILISLPAKAFIGIAVALISLGLSFTQKVKNYFKT